MHRVSQKSECMQETPQSDISIFQVVVDNDDVEVAFLLTIPGINNNNTVLKLSVIVLTDKQLFIQHY